MKYYIGDQSQQFGIVYMNHTDVKDIKLTQILEPVAFLDENLITLPSFIKYDKDNRSFSVDSIHYIDQGKYQVGLRLGYVEFPSFSVECTKPIEVIYEPKFFGKQLSFINLSCLEPWSFAFPVFKDLEGKTAKIEVNLQDTDEFLMYEEYVHELSIIEDLKKHVGFFKFQYTLIDSHEESEEYTVNVIVTCSEKVEVKQNFTPNLQQFPPKPFI